MKKLLLTSVLALTLGVVAAFAQNSPIYTSKVLFDKFAANSEVIININGYEYKYAGDWLRFMKIENDNVISFSRGRVAHHYDIRKIVLIQEEGNFLKVFIR
ncbi:MAG: hypothetical protein K9J06_11895 [Flavobacteriales bacterium]|nr:hypothetical protein [Flavobacteriales bacterium]